MKNTCPVCGSHNIKTISVTEPFKYKGQTIKINDYNILHCNDCEEEIVPQETMKITEKILRDFKREIDGLLTSKEIKKIREQYGFSQENFSQFLGVGIKNFARYENCTVTQSKTMDLLLRIVDLIPEALDIIGNTHTTENKYTISQTKRAYQTPATTFITYKYQAI